MTVLRQVVTIMALVAVFSLHQAGSCLAAASPKGVPARVTMLADHKFAVELRNGIRQAKKSIVACFFLFKVGEKKGGEPMMLVQELLDAQKRGVDVTVEMERDALGKGMVYEQNRRAATLLSQGGVKVRFDTPKVTTHVKAVVIDNRYVYLGSHNLTQSALRYNNELSVMIDSPELAGEVTGYLNKL
jgi:phosphatidylserine/phosphatidylglycerophosphate/cardiolipin synthase-like enzyme